MDIKKRSMYSRGPYNALATQDCGVMPNGLYGCRMLLNKVPDGHYKLSREAILIAELPTRYTSRLNWKGPSPRDLLFMFCRQHWLSEPLFTVKCLDSPDNCLLEFSVKILRVTEPLEDRLEQALFSPPLSKQRVDFAVRHINENHATSLIDFGCGSGSLLDSLLEHSTTLEKIVGVDISVKGLTRAAKVIEHMEEHQAHLFGDVALSLFRPRVLIVSTPNYEYNSILQRSSLPSKEDDPDDKSVPCRFRNFDHKFEWTREQFEHWARSLASRHNYSVVFEWSRWIR
ncbi:hypothetical protein J5N97_017729 [Dioscorea zingiberensis]|uniref:Small RNA 2'-O-methyltransferase n=1 Tax=Dioscorea zingiberensis TaxID=325984 RepID=A0A9D5CMJ5_9LILI|nr:hypothetical protein J5N97_017729 [Dioscorea zingiberensis]